MDNTLLGKNVKVITNNRFYGITGYIVEICYEDDAVMIKYPNGNKGMFKLNELQIL